MQTSEILQEVIRYRPAQLHTGKEWYISYYVFNPESGKLDIKRIKLNHIKNAVQRRKSAYEMIKRLNIKLESGWNPFTEKEGKRAYLKINDAFDHYLKVIARKYKSGDIRNETYFGYTSYLEILREWLKNKNLSELYIYQFDKGIINRFLEYIYVDLKRAAKTRDNYLAFLRVLSTFLIENEYIKIKPTEGISVLGKSHRNGKNRDFIPDLDRAKLSEFLRINDKPMLLACEVLYYCFIRPKEMSYIKIEHINLEKGTIYIPGATAKNYKNAVVTIPKSLKEHFTNLNIKNLPKEFYLFSENMIPGKDHRDEKQFRDRWAKVRKVLKFPLSYKFYSLKDTGITNLISITGDPRIVRDQARHHSISITDLYTPHDTMNGNENIAKTEAIF
jgi:integrase